MQKAIQELEAMGQMPDSDDDFDDETVERYESLLHEIQTPIDLDEAKVLIRIFPPTGLFELEWTLLHIFEPCHFDDPDDCLALIQECPSEEWRESLSRRWENGQES